jgi:hypothetical protein
MAKTSKARRRPAAQPGRGRRGKAGGTAAAVRVRMYRQGLGDCFLLAFPKARGGDYYILIDCGVILGTPDADKLIKAVAADITATTRHIDVLVATHEHWDHVSGFHPDAKLFDGISVGEVWLAWTEDPEDDTARRLKRERNQRLASLWLGLGQMRLRLGADGPERETLDRAAEVLSFFGIDPNDPPPQGGFGAAAAAAGGKTGAAMKWVRERTADPKFRQPGDVIEVPEAAGVRVYVLGPPRDRTQLFKDLPTRGGRETYDDKAHLAAADQSFFAAAFPAGQDGGLGADFDPTLPFDRKYQVSPQQAQASDFFRDHYLGNGPGDPQEWRRIQSEWTAAASEFALQLDSDTNNTSLALAFELPDGRVLLFPADAQVGNWESWHADPDGKARVWKAGGREVTAEALLNRTVLYKVGHHGSHNATLREKGLEMMTDPNLVAMVPVDVYIAHEKKRWKRMPFEPLMSRLAEKTSGRVLQVDEDPPAGLRVTESAKQIEVAGPGSQSVKRPLYVEYSLPKAGGQPRPSSGGRARRPARKKPRARK